MLKGGLRLDTAERTRAGGESGPAIVPNKPDESLLISALRYESNEMPPSGKLPDAVINNFAKWVSIGAPDPRKEEVAADDKSQAKPDPRDHWAYKRPQRARRRRRSTMHLPFGRMWIASCLPDWKRPVCRHRRKLTPRALLRRLYYDLVGLPPTAEELDQFAADPSDARYGAAVDRLLASPRFGERWGRYWLDVARYADTKGYVFEEDRNYKEAYTYRDWVIASFNSDRPYDKFIVAQIAADQVEDKSCAPAIGFLTLGRRFLNNQADIINDRIDVVSRGFMGLDGRLCAMPRPQVRSRSAPPITTRFMAYLPAAKEQPREDSPPMLVDNDKPFDPIYFPARQSGESWGQRSTGGF